MREVLKTGVSVNVTNHIQGFIPLLHLADVPLHHPEKMYKPDMKVKCRVSVLWTGHPVAVATIQHGVLYSRLSVIVWLICTKVFFLNFFNCYLTFDTVSTSFCSLSTFTFTIVLIGGVLTL